MSDLGISCDIFPFKRDLFCFDASKCALYCDNRQPAFWQLSILFISAYLHESQILPAFDAV